MINIIPANHEDVNQVLLVLKNAKISILLNAPLYPGTESLIALNSTPREQHMEINCDRFKLLNADI